MSVEPPRKTLHSKRSFGKYPKLIDSPAYDASEEDNDPLTDDGASTTSNPITRHNTVTSTSSNSTVPNRSAHVKLSAVAASRVKHHLSSLLSDSDGVDSPTYDGDIESSTTAGTIADLGHKPSSATHHHHTSSTSTLNTPITLSPLQSSSMPSPNIETTPNLVPSQPLLQSRGGKGDNVHPVFLSPPLHQTHHQTIEEPAVASVSKDAFNPAALTQEDIQAFVQKAIDGEPGRRYKINPPPTGRPIRVYADGVYDLFHFGHALQLRQAKLAFDSVYLLVGVCSDQLVRDHKFRSVMNHAERLEAARHCRWVDEVVAEAPWVIDQAFLDKYEIDYVAHDEDPYAAVGHEDVYSLAKSLGKFIPTRRTPGISTSSLLERIVSGYRKRDFDAKLTSMGHAELRAEGSDWDEMSISAASSRYASRGASRSESPVEGVPQIHVMPGGSGDLGGADDVHAK